MIDLANQREVGVAVPDNPFQFNLPYRFVAYGIFITFN
jgi:hypothetical protein